MGSQIEGAAFPVKKFQTPDKSGRDDESGVGELERIADHQAGPLLQRRGQEVEIHSKSRQHDRNQHNNAET